MERRARDKYTKKTAVANWTLKKLDKHIFEAILLRETIHIGNAKKKTMQVVEKIRKEYHASSSSGGIPKLIDVVKSALRPGDSQGSRNRMESEK